jgi:hypothetical protein
LEKLKAEYQVKHHRNGKKRILARVVENKGVCSSKKDTRIILIKGSFGITHGRNILDDNSVVRFLSVRE